jgi:hypothetical protein
VRSPGPGPPMSGCGRSQLRLYAARSPPDSRRHGACGPAGDHRVLTGARLETAAAQNADGVDRGGVYARTAGPDTRRALRGRPPVGRRRARLTLLADLDAGTEDRAQLLDRLRMFHEAATARGTALREQLTVAEGFADSLAGHLDARR